MRPSTAPEWLAGFQARFSSVLRTPLDRSTGTLRAAIRSYDSDVGASDGPHSSSEQRLAVYNRQYWFRLFSVMQSAFPLTTRLLGHWVFNDYACRFLLDNPPCNWDIGGAAEGFEDWLDRAASAASILHDLIVEAARVDAAYHRVFRTPAVKPFVPAPDEANRLLSSRLVPSPSVAVIEEHWPLLELRRSLPDGRDGEAPIAAPQRLDRPQWWAIIQRPEGLAQLPLESREGELLLLLGRLPVERALAELEARCGQPERTVLPERARRWLARSAQLGFWNSSA